MKKQIIVIFVVIVSILFFEACHNESEEPPKIIINEILAQNTYISYDKDFYEFSDWIELFNENNQDINLSGYTISRNTEESYTFSDNVVIRAHSYLVIWADGKNCNDKEVHLNFKLPKEGTKIILFSPYGNIIDTLEYAEQQRDISFGKSFYPQSYGYMSPSPGLKNTTLYHKLLRAPNPTFLLKSGFYDTPVELTFQNISEDETIYYTLDGTRPTKNSLLYSNPIFIDKTTVVSAVCYSNIALPSQRVNRTYFIDENSTLPIFSMIIEPRFLYDDTIGIYTVGTNGADAISWCGGPAKANYFQDWERAAYFEYFTADKMLGFSLLAGIEIAGFCTQVLPQKSFTVKMKNKYGEDELKYKLFKDRDIDTFKYFSLRNAGNDWCNAMLRDAFMHRLCDVMGDIPTQAYQPTLLFINGKYWGIYNLREKQNKAYLQSHYNIKKVDLLENNMTVKEGSAQEYSELIEYIKNNDLSNDENYNYVCSKIDIDQFIDYYISEIYFANNDWPGNNILYWKEQDNENAKWRWMLHDTDFGFDLQHKNGFDFNMLTMVTSSYGPIWPNPPWSTFLLRNLLYNDTFKEYFIDRSMMQIDNIFQAGRVKSVLENMSIVIEPEIQRQYDRWSSAEMPADVAEKYPTFKSIQEWHEEIDRMKNFADRRNCFVKKHFFEMFDLGILSCEEE